MTLLRPGKDSLFSLPLQFLHELAAFLNCKSRISLRRRVPYGTSLWQTRTRLTKKTAIGPARSSCGCCEIAFRSNSYGSGTGYLSAARTHTRHSSLRGSSFPSGGVHGWSRNGTRAVCSAQARTRTGCRVRSGPWGLCPGDTAPHHPALFRRNESWWCCTSLHNLRITIYQSRSEGYEIHAPSLRPQS